MDEKKDLKDELQKVQEALEPENETKDQAESPQHPDYTGEILELIRGNESPERLRTELEDYHEKDIAEVLEQLTVQERKKIFRVLPVSMLGEIFEYVEENMNIYLDEMNVRKAVDVLTELDADTAVEVLRSMNREKRNIMIELLDADSRKDIALIASFDEEEIGSRMSTNFILIQEGMTIKEAMRSLVGQASKNDNISTIFVEAKDHTFYGALDLKDLIIARESDQLDDLIMTSFPYLYAQESIDDCIEKLKDYSESLIPLLDEQNRMLGVITSQSIIEVVDDEMGEDYAKLAGLAAEEDLKEPLRESIKKRLPWLLILLGLGMGVSTVVGLFEQVVQQLTILMIFQSMILDMAGNVGTQSLAVTIRVLMDETLTRHQKMQLVWKEARVGMCNGALLGSLSFIIIGLFIFLFKGKSFLFSFAVSGCIGLSLLIAMLISSLGGALVPQFFKKIGVDPAVASGPLITTLNDLVAVITYYGLSWVFLLQILHLAG